MILADNKYGKDDALYWAVGHDSLAHVAERLIAAGADVNYANPSDDDVTPLSLAAFRGCVHAVEQLIAAGVDINYAKPANSVTPLLMAVDGDCGDRVHVVERLIAAGADVNKAKTDTGATPLMLAAQHGHVDVVERLIAAPEVSGLWRHAANHGSPGGARGCGGAAARCGGGLQQACHGWHHGVVRRFRTRALGCGASDCCGRCPHGLTPRIGGGV
jgi:ankyrin repeat protein